MDNPWNLTARECEVLDALTRLGNNKAIGNALGVAESTIEAHLHVAGRSMNISKNRVLLALTWDRWRRAQGAAN